MGHWTPITLFLFISLLRFNYGCRLEGVIDAPFTITDSILDTHRGTIFNLTTTDITGIINIQYGSGLNSGPYLQASHSGSQFLLTTTDLYAQYEEHEILNSLSITIEFRCVGGDSQTRVFWIAVEDTNNNAPVFLPSNEFEFTIATPVPPGFAVTGCLHDITVRDIDLTTLRIDFSIEENPYFEIMYDEALSTTPKEFKALLRTTTLIRTIPEPITLRISATDVDQTNDPPITTYATVRIMSDTDFQFPEEPVFSQAFYLATYTEEHTLVHDPISLRQGYDDLVEFSLQGDHVSNFELVRNGNHLSVRVRTPLPADVMLENQILLVVRAERNFTSGGSSTIIIQLPNVIPLEFERAHYNGLIVDNTLQLQPLRLTQGYEGLVTVSITSDFSSNFNAEIQGGVITITMSPLNESVILENNFIYLHVVASTDHSSASAIVTLEVVKDDVFTPAFDRALYTGNYDPTTNLVMESIRIVNGFDDTVALTLEGDYREYFQIVQTGPNINVRASTLPPEMYSEQHLLLTIRATKPRTVGATATIVISLPEARILDFEDLTYRGTLRNNVLTLETIILRGGYDDTVSFSVSGDYANYFTVSSVQNQVNLNLLTPLPDSVIAENSFIILTLGADGLNAVTANATILLEIIKEDISTPLFSRNIYYATYNGQNGIDIENINLIQGYDQSVTFRIEGEHSQYFGISNSGNNVVLSLTSPIPADVIYREKVLSISIIANKELTVGANTAVLIRFPVELTEPVQMRFSQNTYLASIENDQLSVESIMLSVGYESGTQFLLTGDYAEYFQMSNNNDVISVSLRNPLPDVITADNSLLVLEIEARRERAVSVSSTIVIDITEQITEIPVFSGAYYRGIYEESTGLLVHDAITLSSGYDDTVTFSLEGEFASLFNWIQNNNVVTLSLPTSIPEDVLKNNDQLIISIIANKPNAINGSAAIIIDLQKESIQEQVLQFERVTYVGTIANNTATVDPIVLSQGFASNVVFALHGELMSYFRLSSVGNTVTIQLANAIPETSIPENGIIVLELQASAPGAITAHTTVVFTVVTQEELVPIVELVFSESHYTGSYTDLGGLVFTTPISLSQGYDDTVQFALEGDDAQWFGLVRSQNSVTVTLTSAIPANVVANNHHLIFSVTAHRPGGTTARTTVVIALADEYTEEMNMLGFERVTYVGTIANNTATVDPIVLSQGFASNVVFALHGELMSYFRLSSVGNTVTIQLANAIPETSIPENGIIVLELQASAPGAITAHTTVVFTVVTQEELVPIVELVFSESHYTGSYTDLGGLVFTTPISLSQGYDATVQFALEGVDAQWFGLVRSQNSVTVTLTSAIPANVVANNHHLIFSVTAHRPGGTTARTTVVIALADEYTEEMNMLGFERVTYVGTIANNTATVDPIVLSQGFASNVVFALHGELMSYFRLSSVGNTVTIQLANAIPETSIPENGIIVLELQASAPGAISAHTTVVFTVVTQEELVPIVELVFSESHYTGSYTDLGGLVFTTPISLSQGYDATVQFALEGVDAQWFGLVRSQNSVTVTLTSAIPANVVANNHHLIFSVTAHRPGGTTARTTVVIALADEYTEEMNMLGFERVTYVGTIANNTATVDPIVLSQGFASNVVFALHGELMSYFRLSSVGNTVTIQLANAIPDTSIPENGIIVLELQASAPGAITAHTTVVFTVVTQEELVPIVELVFSESHYTGSYTDLGGLVFTTPISLSQGYDDTVQFALEGVDAQWFGLVRSQNSVTVTLTSAIPANVVANNHHLIFSVTAHRPGGTTARTTVVIALADEYTEEMNMLGFERVTYVGTIANNTATVDPIVLSQGFASNVVFALHGELMSYFRLSSVGNTVTIQLANAIPDTSIPENGIIVLELQASAPGAITAHTTVVFTVVTQEELVPIVELVFSESHYTGSYTDLGGLVFTTPISLSQGYDDTVQFALEGVDAQWFGLVRSQNSVTVTLTSAIPANVVANNHHLIFSVTAHRPGGTTARTTVVIALADEYTEEMNMLGFERVTYVGTIANNTATVDPIVLSQGFASNVVFTLHGELMSYFRLSSVGNTVTIQLANAIPETSIPENGIIVLELQASAPGAITAHTTVVFTVVTQEELVPIVELVFSESHYTGSYTDLGGLVFTTPISLSQGYDDTVQFALEGDDAQWFGLVRSQNSVTVTLTSAIPANVVANNHHLIFSVTAYRPGGTTARTTVVIALADEYTEEMNMLGFERVTYVGTIANNTATVDPIVLSQGFASNVVFALHGELMSYFRLSSVGNTVTIQLANAIPDTSIPENGIIVLELQASAPGAITAHTTVVFTVVTQEELVPIVELVFSESHYTGSYTDLGGLVFTTPISLSQGYDDTVQFALEGVDAQWFGLVRSQNSVTVTLTSAIPANVVANNHHLIFSVTAHRPGGTTARTTVVIALADEYTEEMNMLGFERVTYVGTIANNTATVDPIVLSQGFASNVVFALHGELMSYFRLSSVGNTVTIQLANAIPDTSIPENGIIVLELQASAPGAITAHTTVVFTVVTQEELVPIVELVFSESHYTGSYTDLGGLVFTTPISLSQGYDDTVQFALEGVDAQWFGLVRSQNSVTVTLTSAIPANVVANNHHLIFSVTAHRPGGTTARTTVVIALADEYTEEMNMLGFERVTYVGTIANNTATVDPIVLSQGFASNVVFTLHGELMSYFRLSSVGNTVTIQLANAIPETSIPENGIIVLELQASAPGAITAHTTVVFTVVTQEELVPIVELVFSESHYTGSYTDLGGLVFTTPISLSQGYDDTVQFALEGDDAQWFGLVRSQNSVTVTLTSAIPANVVANNHHLIFSVTAHRPGGTTARTTVVIALADEYTEEMNMLGFERVTYVGTIANNTATVDPIVLSQGFASNVVFALHGELMSYFRLSSVGNTVTIQLANAIPETSIPENGIIVLELQASAPGAITAHTTVVFTVVTQEELVPIVELVFSESHYTGSYTDLGGLVFTTPISLSQGYDDTVQFALEGVDAQWFGLVRSQNSVTVTLTSAIPANVVANNHHLIFSVTAHRPGGTTARTTVVIALADEYTEEMNMLGFERVTYVGTIANNTATVDPIVLSQGFASNVVFALHGELMSYFRLSSVGNTVTIQLANAIPDTSIPENGIIVLELQASAPGAITAHTTVVFTVVTQEELVPIVELVFSESHYTGSYTDLGGLVFTTPISLSQGYDDTVQFALEGVDAQWFGLVRSQNSVTVTLTSAIPANVVANNHHLIFSVTAHRPGGTTARTTVVIALADEYTEEMNMLGFERVTYVGTIANNTATVDPIVLSQGFASNVVFTLHGELMSYFRLSSVGNTVTIQLANAIPETSIPENGIIVLELQASAPGAITAHTTVVFTVVTQEELVPIVELVFSESHYTGSYTDLGGLVFTTPISLSQGYDDTVQFALEGDDAQWFGLVRSQNSVTVTLTSAIPANVVANNHHLIFSVTAHRPGGTTARTTVVIALADEYTEEMNMLGFERVTYVGTIANNTATVDPIVLSQGFASNVVFALHGELMSYFRLSSVGNTVTIQLANAIPETSIPENGIIVLELQASAPGAITAHTTVVFTVVTQEELVPIVELVFSESHYTGSYTDLGGLVFTTPISLSQGYDATVQFALEGVDAQWFGLVRSQNSVTVTLTSAIPANVVANNHHLIFSVTAHRPGGTTARTTVVIALADEYTEEMNMLGFERVTYVGTIANNTATVDPIVLSQGFASNVVFTLHGELMSYFRLSSVGNTVTIQLANAIPETSIPENGIIVLELQASAPGAITAHTTVVFTVVTQEELVPIVELVFSESHYTGSYTDLGGLVFTTPISLSQGYDDTVQFALEGVDAQWFGLVRSQNSVTVTLTSAIPANVVANNHHLIFSVTAHRPGGTTARTTVVIALADEYTEEMNMLGFERVTYVGTIANNTATVDPIVLSQGFASNVVFALHGELMSYFRLSSVGNTVTIQLANAIPDTSIPENGIIVLELQASAPGAITAHTTVVFTVVTQEELVPIVELVFSESHYTGSYTDLGGLVFTTPISLSQGYDDTVQFALEGVDAQWFGLVRSQNSVTVTLTSAIPANVVANNHHLIFSVTAQRPGGTPARATIIISLNIDTETELGVSFDKVLYEGILQDGVVRHENIILVGYAGADIEIHGEFSGMFSAHLTGDQVVVQMAVWAASPDVSHVALELHASHARAVLLLTVISSDAPVVPVVTFSSPTYSVSIDDSQTGLIGRVVATADNGESVRYTVTPDENLRDRLSINENGEIFLSAPTESGNYNSLVIATTIFTQVRAQATVYLTVEARENCGEGNLPPLIIIDRDEETPHQNLVVLDQSKHPGCRYILANRWPEDQPWLYVNETGLHTSAIDREHDSIAFMALSQVKVELTLHCESDNERSKRSLDARPDLGPYDYGNNEWILSSSIPYNPRQTVVNLIVNDINDNHPIFVGKENEPIAVGYPIDELAEMIMPRSLVELHATDADVGINAALLYWSTEDVISVAPTTGFVHVRDGARIENDTRLIIHATDRNGVGLSGSIEILVKLLNTENIVVLMIRNAFLDDETNILTELSNALGYDVKVLRSTVMPDGAQANQDDSSRKRRNAQATGSSLQLYVYGMIEREPVTVERFIADVNNNAIVAVTVASVVSLQDYLEGREICVIPGRDTGLLVATILLSILLFILIVLIAVWFMLKRRNKVNYDEFSDENSLASRNEPIGPQPKPVHVPKPRLNIDELKKSERRLQEMLQAPVLEAIPTTSSNELPLESVIDMPPPDSPAPIVTVIQSIDKLKDATDESDTDEFGEVDTARRKSVVTFNENVEKIIHVEDNEDLSTLPGYEIYKL